MLIQPQIYVIAKILDPDPWTFNTQKLVFKCCKMIPHLFHWKVGRTCQMSIIRLHIFTVHLKKNIEMSLVSLKGLDSCVKSLVKYQIFGFKWKPHGLGKAYKFSAHPGILNILKIYTQLWVFSKRKPQNDQERNFISTVFSQVFGGRAIMCGL